MVKSNTRTKRVIPTPVGNGFRHADSTVTKTGHPHACGERQRHLSWKKGYIGSSPRLWGTAGGADARFDSARVIPTPVGNGSTATTRAIGGSGHPHACGERRYPERQINRRPGSSPRLWGTVFVICRTRRLARVIPTPVGNGLALIIRTLTSSGHPHACGERLNVSGLI